MCSTGCKASTGAKPTFETNKLVKQHCLKAPKTQQGKSVHWREIKPNVLVTDISMPFNKNHKQYIKGEYIIHNAWGLKQDLWIKLKRFAQGRLKASSAIGCLPLGSLDRPHTDPRHSWDQDTGHPSLHLCRSCSGHEEGQGFPSLHRPDQSPFKLCQDPLHASL